MSLFKKTQKHARIKPNQVFLNGRDRFEPGQVYRVDINLARYFARKGWLEGSDPVLPTTAAIEVDNGTLGQSGGF